MKKIKLLVVTPYFFPHIGGVENYVYNITKNLKKNYNYEVALITTNLEGKKITIDELEGMKIYRLPYQFKISNTPISFKWKRQIKEIIEEENPDIINAHTPVPFISDVTCRIANKKGVPFLLTYHNDLVKGNFFLNLICKVYYLFLGDKTLNESTKIIATSDYYSNHSPYLKKRLKRIAIVSPGINLPKDTTFLKNKNKILFVGQLDKTHHHKGLNYLIESVSLAKNKIKDIQLSIIGTGDNLQEYEKKVKELNLAKEIKFLGRLSDEDLSTNYSTSQIILLPSYNRSEGFGMVLIEGMAHKCVAIGTKVGGIPYAINEKNDGLLVPPKDSKAIADAIIKILDNPKLAKQMGENGYKKVKENFTWDIQIKKMDEIIRGVLRK